MAPQFNTRIVEPHRVMADHTRGLAHSVAHSRYIYGVFVEYIRGISIASFQIRLNEVTLLAAWERGARLPLEQAVTEALAELEVA